MSAAAWQSLLVEPASLNTDADFHNWFDAIASRMLNGDQLLVGDRPHRLTEIEFYYHGPGHLDTFAHCDPIQKETGRWYFHRTGGVYRNGSFKGFDLTFGSRVGFGGVLIRGMEQEDGSLIDGPSLSVDHMLRQTEAANVATFDEAIESRAAWDEDSPLRLRWLDAVVDRPILRTARVGLTLKRLRKSDGPPRLIMRRYRYLSEPRRISKGKTHMVLALHADGRSPTEIRETTGGTRGAIERYIADFKEGQTEPDFTRYFGLEIGPRDLCRLHGLWYAKHGPGALA